jgi:hypothetical protein
MRCQTCKDTRLNDHDTYGYGQSSYDGDACSTCRWQGPCNSAQEHKRCQDCLDIHPDTDGVTLEMVEVAKGDEPAAPTVDEANEAYDRRDSYAEGYDDGSAAALAAAPTVDGLVWCEHEGGTHRSDQNRCASGHYHPESFDACSAPCPGPHDRLIRVPKATT